jgi:hypothetical protein
MSKCIHISNMHVKKFNMHVNKNDLSSCIFSPNMHVEEKTHVNTRPLFLMAAPLSPVGTPLSHLLGGRRELERVIAREEGYTFIAAPRSPDLRHRGKSTRHLCYCSNEQVLHYWLVFITAGPIIKLCLGGRGTVEDMCYGVRRAEACVD